MFIMAAAAAVRVRFCVRVQMTKSKLAAGLPPLTTKGGWLKAEEECGVRGGGGVISW